MSPDDLVASAGAQPLLLVAALGALTLVPFAVMLVTSFVKIAVVLSMVRTAIGVPQIPPTLVVTGLSLLLTVQVMTPVARRVAASLETALTVPGDPTPEVGSEAWIARLATAAPSAAEPVRTFLRRHAHPRERAAFAGLGARLDDGDAPPSKDSFSVLVPAFVLSELKEAFQIGFIVFLPFVVVDLAIANVLMALGMQMLSPTTISLPFKLLLFVLIDGWFQIVKGLMEGYA